jgi:phytoene/squalene synthetase
MTLVLCPIEDMVAKADPDRWAAALYAKPNERLGLASLYAFAYEVGRIREIVTDPLLGAIRRQWWREAIGEIYGQSPVRQHQTVIALAETVQLYQIDQRIFDTFIDAREIDFEQIPFANWADLLAYLDQTAGGLAEAAGRIVKGSGLSEVEREAAKLAGRVWGLAGLMRSLPFWSQRRQTWIPKTLLIEHEIEVEGLFAGKVTNGLHSLLLHCAREVKLAVASIDPIASGLYPALGYSALAVSYASKTAKLSHPFRQMAQISPIERNVRLFFSAATGRI